MEKNTNGSDRNNDSSYQNQIQKLESEVIQNQKPLETVIDKTVNSEERQNNKQQDKKQQNGQDQHLEREEVKFEEVAVEEEEDELIEDDMQKASEYKKKGGQFFKAGNQIQAIEEYDQAMKYTTDHNLRATLCSNISICLIKDQNYTEAKRYCTKALKYNQNLRKARTNLARCYEAEEKYEEALDEYKKLQNDAPVNEKEFIRQRIQKNQARVDESNERKKKQVIDGLKNIGNSVLGYFGMSLDNFKLEQGAGGGYNISFKQ